MRRIILLLAVVATLASCSKDKVKIEINLEEGQEYFQTMTMEGTMKQKLGEQNMNTDMTTSMRNKFVVKKANPDYYDLEVSFDYMTMELKNQMGNMKFDSRNPDTADIFSQIMGAMTDNFFTVKMKKDGSIMEVGGIDQMFKNVFDNFGQISPQERMQLQAQLESQFGSDAFKDQMKFSATYPEEGIAVGDTWEVEIPVQGTEQVYKTTYTVKEINSEDIVLEANGDIDMKVNATEESSSEASGNVNITQKIDRKTGWLISGEGKMTMNMVTQAMGMEIPTEMDMNITMSGE